MEGPSKRVFAGTDVIEGERLRRMLLATAAALILTLFTLGVGGVLAPKRVVLGIENQGTEIKLTTFRRTVGGALEKAGIKLNTGDRVIPDVNERLREGMQITVLRAAPIRLTVDGTTQTIPSAARTVGEFIEEAGIVLGELDRVVPSKGSALTPETAVQVIRVQVEFVKEVSSVPFTTKRVAAPDLERGKTKVMQPGKEGQVEKEFRLVYEDGKLVKKELVGSHVIAEPQPRIIGEGTREVVHVLSTAHGPIRYKKVLDVVATAYAPGPQGGSKASNNYTYTGMIARRGIVAVDPKVIPLGTRVYVPGYGEALAADIGGAIKGNRIDLCFDTVAEAIQFGRKSVKVYILA